ncbi:pyridoxamine 5'-phosphate oxidase [Actinomadura sp. NBRC 104412]|uniref:pyridoxamine 5'-phosphate oxidase family protein n=1 Tax=Actinomadura sp. NBRC 104412 TaxID=3032203 RepID=UPI0024A5F987|nr:pyridoxamine 5'-phosphate oxidase family protein [Actinomadura sp. NBRC 104412]GLZ08974.1 pyridoxamine 5'-phosphate oxidase [Actinomadura sp. NBRC 104412]
MAGIEPTNTTNLDNYGSAPLLWSRALDALRAGLPSRETTMFLGTIGPDGRPRAAGLGCVWNEGRLYFVSGPRTLKSRNLASSPYCTISGRLDGIDLVLEGEAHRVTDEKELDEVAALYRQGGWPAESNGEALTAPSAPRAPARRRGISTSSPSTRLSVWPPPNPTARRNGTSPRSDEAEGPADGHDVRRTGITR